MKILLNRFCPKGLSTDQISYEQLLAKFTQSPPDKTPTAKQLEASDVGILYQHCDADGRFYILENGFILYRYTKEIFISGKRKLQNKSTVIPTNKVRFAYDSLTSNNLDIIPKEVYKDLPFLNVILMFATIRLQNNVNSKEKTIVSFHIEDEERSMKLSSPDFADTYVAEISVDYQKLYLALDTLTDKQKEVVYLYYYERLNQEQIASKIGIGRTSVQDRLDGALKKLKKHQNLHELL